MQRIDALSQRILKVENKNKQARRKPAARSPRMAAPKPMGFSFNSLSECAAKYATAIADPWNPLAQGACVPRHPARPSQKLALFNRFQMVVGGTGDASQVGIITVHPCLSKDMPSLMYTTNTSDLHAIPNSSAKGYSQAVGMSPVYTNCPYSTAQLTETVNGAMPEVQGRIVSFGVSVQYMGTQLNEGGIVTQFTSANHDSVYGYSWASLPQNNETVVDRISDKRMWFVGSGLDEQELTYGQSVALNANGTPNVTNVVYPFSRGQTVGLNSNYSGTATADFAIGATSITTTTITGTAPVSAPGFFYYQSDDGSGIVGTQYSAVATVSGVTTFTVIPLTSALKSGKKVSNGGISSLSGLPILYPAILGGAPTIITLAPGNPTVPNIFEIEYVVHVEYVGPATTVSQTPTHTDSLAFERVSAVATGLQKARADNPTVGPVALMMQGLRDAYHDMQPQLLSVAKTGALQIASGAANMGLAALSTRYPGAASALGAALVTRRINY